MGKTTFIDGSYSTGVVGTRISAALFNKLNNQRHTGRDIDGEGALDYATTGGSSNTYTLALTPSLDAYIPGMPFYFKASFANTGAASMNINGLGAVAFKKNVSADLVAGDIVSGKIYIAMYDGTIFQLLNPQFLPSSSISVSSTVTWVSEIDNGTVATATANIDWTAGNKQKVTVNGAPSTFTFTAPPGPCNVLLKITMGAASRTIAWPSSVKWVGGSAPTFSAVSGYIDIVGFYFDGTNYYGTASTHFA